MASTSTPNRRERESPLINLTDDTSVKPKRLRTAKLEPASYLPPQISCLPHATERIEAMATSLEEAITIAASTGQAANLENLLNKFHGNVYDLTEAVIAAASNGDRKCLEVFGEFFLDLDYDDKHLVTNNGRQIMANGLIPAARNGHYDVVDYLKSISTDRDLIREETLLYRDFVFYKAAVSKAIAQGYADVVGFVVLNYPEDADSMLEEAVAAGLHRVASEIRKAVKITEEEDFE